MAADGAWQELVPRLEQPPVGEMVRLRNSASMEGSRGLRRLTGQKAEPPWGVKFTLLGSGQEEIKAGLSWCEELEEEKKKSFKGWGGQKITDVGLQMFTSCEI